MYGEYLDLFIRVVTGVGAIGAMVASWRNSGKIQEVHLLMNSRLDELLRVSKKEAKREGADEERAEQKASGNGDDFIIKKLRE